MVVCSRLQYGAAAATAALALAVQESCGQCTCPGGSTPVFNGGGPCAGGPPTGPSCPSPPGGGGTQTPGGPTTALCTDSCTAGNLAGCLAACATTCPNPPCAASLLGDVGTTSVTGTDSRTSKSFPVGENIYGPFEAGFTSQQDNILQGLGCSDPSNGYVPGGIDTNTAEQMVAQGCGVTLPRIVDNSASGYISLIDECGGHTNEYHFHEKFSCLYALSGQHSTQIGWALDGRPIHGKWEDWSVQSQPELDACSGHFGATPDSNGQEIYHYHVQDAPPFAVGCFGPGSNGGLVSVAECRATYSGAPGCGDGDVMTVNTPLGSKTYDLWCPCYDGNGSNVGTVPLPALTQVYSWSAGNWSVCPDTACGNMTAGTVVGNRTRSVACVHSSTAQQVSAPGNCTGAAPIALEDCTCVATGVPYAWRGSVSQVAVPCLALLGLSLGSLPL